MLQWFRARARSIAAVAFVSLATLTVWSAAPHGEDCHDAMCSSLVVPHDPSAHSIKPDASSTSERPLHCVLCHWTRIVRPPAATAQFVAPVVHIHVRPFIEVFSAPQFVSAAQPPLRAPPASPALDA
jgi:hypothetical protein